MTADGDNVSLAAAGDLNADVTAGTDATLNATGNLTADVQAGRDASLTSGGTMTAVLDVTRNTTINSGGNLTVSGESRDLTATSGGTTSFGRTTLTGDLNVTSAGDVTQTGKLDITGTTDITSTNGDVTLDQADNDFRGVVNAAGNDITIVDGSGGISLGNVNAFGTLDLTSTGGDIVQSTGTSITVSGQTTFTATDGASPATSYDITVNNATNLFAGIVNATGKDIDMGGSSVLKLGDVTGAALIIGTKGSSTDVTIDKPFSIDGSITVYGGDVTLAAGLIAGEDYDIVISASENFINTFGAGVLNVTGAGRWVVYVGNARGNTYGGLDSGNTAVWNSSIDSMPIAFVPDGNRYVFDQDPIRTVIVTTTDAAKTYGETIDVSGNYLIASPGIPGVAGAYLGVEEITTLTMVDVFTQGSVFDPALVSALQTEASALVGTGTADITLAPGTANVLYDVTYESVGKLAINRRAIELRADSFSIIYGESDPALTVSIIGGSVATGIGDTLADVIGSLSRTGDSNAGVYNIVLGTGAKAENYEVAFDSENGVFQIHPQPLTLTANASSKMYGEADPSLAYEIQVANAGQGLLAGDELSGAVERVSGENVGSYAILQGTLGNPNYDITWVSEDLTIIARPITLSADLVSKLYGDADPLLTVSIATGFLGSVTVSDTLADVTGVLNRAVGEKVGQYNVVLGKGSASPNYEIVFEPNNAAFEISARSITLSADVVGKVYGDIDPGLSVSIIAGDLASGAVTDSLQDVTGTLSRTLGEDAGQYDIALGSGQSAANYAISFVQDNKAFGISRRPIALAVDSVSITYGDADPALTATIVSGSLASALGDSLVDVVGTLSRTGDSNVGVYDIVAGTGSKSQNYDIAFDSGQNAFEITKARLVARGSKVYDGSIQFGGADLAVQGVNDEQFVVSCQAWLASKHVQLDEQLASLNGLSVGDGTGLLSNYEALTLSDTSVTVTPRAVTLSADAVTKTYDGTLLYEMTSADLQALSTRLVGGDSVSAAELVFDSKDVSRAPDRSVLGNRIVTLSNIRIDDGNNGQNYSVTTIDATNGRINPAMLTVTAVNDAKFVTQVDPAGYLGVIYNGFVGGENERVSGLFSQVGAISRSNPAEQGAGTYTDVLVASGWRANNYEISFEAGDFTIVPADTLLIRAPAMRAIYGERLPSFDTITAQYLDSKDNQIKSLIVDFDVATQLYSAADGLGSSATFEFALDQAPLSSAGLARAGGYNVAPGPATTFSGDNFQGLVMVGALTVEPKTLNADLGISDVAKVYDGNRSVTGLDLSFSDATAGVVSGDELRIVGNGAYADRHVGINKTVELSLALRGADANNYMLASNSYSANVGTITQLASVAWTGEQSQNWSDVRNWVGGALPDRNNVANVVIPGNATVLYDSDQLGVIGSAIANDGTIRFASNNPFTLANSISGTGTIEQRGAGMLTMAGNSTFTGATDIGGWALSVASNNGLGAGNLISSGGQLIVLDGVSIAGLIVTGPIGLYSNVVSAGDQTYNGVVTLATGSLANPLTIASASGNLTFSAPISAGQGSKAAQRSLTLQGNRVTIGDQVGLAVKDMLFGNYQGTQDTNPYALRIVGNEIYLLADITTFESQRYEGPVFIGDNGSNGFTRTLISLDPSVTFTNTVDAVIDGLHGLDVRAYTMALDLNETPMIDFEGAVGQTRALASLFADVGLQNRQPTAPVATPAPNLPPTVGQVTIAGNVATTGSQTYRGNSVTLGHDGQTITLDARSGTVEVIVGVGAGAGIIGLDRVRLALGEFTEVGEGLTGLLRSNGIDPNRIITRTGFDSNAAISASGALSGSSMQRIEQKIIETQAAAGKFEIDAEQQQRSSMLLEGEVAVGEIESLTCGESQAPDETGHCSANDAQGKRGL